MQLREIIDKLKRDDESDNCVCSVIKVAIAFKAEKCMYRGYGDNHTIINHQFVRVRVREEPHWQGASNNNNKKIKTTTFFLLFIYIGQCDIQNVN